MFGFNFIELLVFQETGCTFSCFVDFLPNHLHSIHYAICKPSTVAEVHMLILGVGLGCRVLFKVSFIEQSLLVSEGKNGKDFKSFPGFDKVAVKFEATLHKKKMALPLVLELSA